MISVSNIFLVYFYPSRLQNKSTSDVLPGSENRRWTWRSLYVFSLLSVLNNRSLRFTELLWDMEEDYMWGCTWSWNNIHTDSHYTPGVCMSRALPCPQLAYFPHANLTVHVAGNLISNEFLFFLCLPLEGMLGLDKDGYSFHLTFQANWQGQRQNAIDSFSLSSPLANRMCYPGTSPFKSMDPQHLY